jgi:beta-lactamase class A
VRNRSIFITLRWISISLIFAAVGLLIFQLITYSRIRANMPPGMVIAGIPVGGLDQQDAAKRLLQAYTAVPLELRYRDAAIQIKPSVIGYELNIQAMMTAADQERLKHPFWPGFWDFLWNQLPTPQEIPLRASYSEDRLRLFLTEEVAARYDHPAEAARPIPGSSAFEAGKVGTILDVDRAVTLIASALKSPAGRVVNLTFDKINPTRPPFQNLDEMLRQKILVSDFDGLIEVYMSDLQTGRTVHFAYNKGDLIPPDVAFTAASTMKIPIMVSVFRRLGDPLPEDVQAQVKMMVELSQNDPADRLVETVIDKTFGPLEVTKDLQALGLKNTFWAGYFYPGAQLLSKVQTPANQRTDVNAGRDLYNQTTAAEMGMLLEDIYRCGENGGGTFAAVFPYQMSQSKCQMMINFLVQNKIASLLQAGLPEGTRIAHKHGWVIENDGLMRTIADAGIVYTPGGNYVISVFMYDENQLLFPPSNLLMAEISNAIYNYYNLPGEQ